MSNIAKQVSRQALISQAKRFNFSKPAGNLKASPHNSGVYQALAHQRGVGVQNVQKVPLSIVLKIKSLDSTRLLFS